MGQRDGEYKAFKLHGLNNKFQTAWYKPPNFPLRQHWLKDGGLDDNDEYVAQCLFCKTSFRCRLRT
eukprot:1143115-Pelagomonas_calceolata.AAC.1